MPKGYPKDGVNKGWFTKGFTPVNKRPRKDCLICNKSIPSFRKFCSNECRNESYKGKSLSPATQFKKGNKPTHIKKGWRAGHEVSQETRDKIKASLTGRKRPELTGEKHFNWKGGITPKYRLIRNSPEYRLWREAVFARDAWTCKECGKAGGRLHAHHIKTFAEYPELRFAIDNGVTLCIPCHEIIHGHKIPMVRRNKNEQD